MLYVYSSVYEAERIAPGPVYSDLEILLELAAEWAGQMGIYT